MASKPSAQPVQHANGFPSRRDRPWLLPYNRRLRNLASISLRNLTLSASPSSRARGKTIDDDAVPNNLVSPAKLVALREQKSLGHSRSSSDLRRVPEDEAHCEVGRGKAEQSTTESISNSQDKSNGNPKTPPRPSLAKLRRRSTLEWANASPQSRQEKLEGVTAERMADVFFSLHVDDVQDPIYVSEIVEHTMNPTFRSIDFDSCSSGITRLDHLTVRFWIQNARWESWRQLLEISSSLRELQYLGKHLEELERPLPQNAVIFQLSDGFYTTFTSLAQYAPSPFGLLPARTNSTRTLHSSSFDALLRLAKLDDSIQDALATRDKIAADLEALLQQHKSAMVDRDRVAEGKDRLKTIEYAKKTVAKQLAKARTQAAEKRSALTNRRELMSRDVVRRNEKAVDMQTGRHNTPTLRASLGQDRKHIQNQRRRICEDLQKIYQIQPVKNKPLVFTINDLPLPNSEDIDASSPETTAAALGHIAHTLQLLSFYLGHPLVYPVTPRASTSTIYDPISLLKTNARESQRYGGGGGADKTLRTYPLFLRGVPRFRFEYALFLLNKDIQLLLESAFGVRVLDIRHTLPNLKYALYVATAGEGELPARRAGGVRGLVRGAAAAADAAGGVGGGRSASSSDSASSAALSGLLWHGHGHGRGRADDDAKGAVGSLRRNVVGASFDKRSKVN